jgi:hypothetical protein
MREEKMSDKKNGRSRVFNLGRRYTHSTIAGIEDAIAVSIDILFYSNEFVKHLRAFINILMTMTLQGNSPNVSDLSTIYYHIGQLYESAKEFEDLLGHRTRHLLEILQLLRRGPYAYNPDREAKPRLKIEKRERADV